MQGKQVPTINLPEAVAYTPLHVTVRTKKVADKKFCATGAWYFGGKQGMYLSACATTRRRAVAVVEAILEHGENWRRYIGRDTAWESERFLRAAEGY